MGRIIHKFVVITSAEIGFTVSRHGGDVMSCAPPPPGQWLCEVERFDPSSTQWSLIAPMHHSRTGVAVTALRGGPHSQGTITDYGFRLLVNTIFKIFTKHRRLDSCIYKLYIAIKHCTCIVIKCMPPI